MEPFKEALNANVVRQLGQIFARVHGDFDAPSFCGQAEKGLQDLELKERANHIMRALDSQLPNDFTVFSAIILASLHPSEDPSREGAEFGPEGVMGFAAWPVTDLVTERGIARPDEALELLKQVTKRFSAEFAVRPFLDQHTEKTLAIFEGWMDDENRHVRRLVSEGSRPRLPWGMQLKKFVGDPAKILPLLETLRDDDEEYVRRSVANSLNDIAKDHPDMVAEIAGEWLVDANKNRQRLVKHACRTLLKNGHEGALKAFGYGPVPGLECALTIKTPTVHYGEALVFDANFETPAAQGKMMVDYAIHFMKANGKTAPKVFKWKDISVKEQMLSAARKHKIRPITTRKYYAGEHVLEIFVNGVSVAKAPFVLVM